MKRALLFAAIFLFSAAPAVAAGPSPGAAGIGDPLFPGLGNGGYDVQHYDVDVRYGKAFTDPVEGNVTLIARATQALSRFNLDFAGRSVGGVVVNGAPAQWRRDGSELVITPRKAIKELLVQAGLSHHLAGERLASGAGLITALVRQPAALFQIDEFGRFLANVIDKRRAPKYLSEIWDLFTELEL